MARGDQLGRQWRLIQILISSVAGKTVSELSDRTECHPRTVYRDLEALQIAGFPIYTEKREGKNAWMILDAAKHQMPIPLSLTELMALYFSRDMLKILKDTVFFDSLKSLFQKIKATLPEEYKNYLKQIESNLHVGQKPYKRYKHFKETINNVNTAVENKKHIDISYYTISRDEETKRRVAPYKIWFFDGTFYLIAFCTMRNEIRLFALDRITCLTITAEPFAMPEDFNVHDYMKSSFGVFQGETEKVKIRFSQEVAGYIKEKTWHESQVIETLDDGSIIFTANVAGIREIKYWIMNWGPDATVLSPESLRNQIISETCEMLNNYQAGCAHNSK